MDRSEPLHGNLDRLLLRIRESRDPADCLVQDTRAAIHGRRRNPGYTCVAVVLTSGIQPSESRAPRDTALDVDSIN